MKEELLSKLYSKWAGETVVEIKPLPISGSNRLYFRISSATKNAVGVYNEDKKENLAFLEFSKHFKVKNLAVPEVYASDLEHGIYLLQDLGDTTLFSFITENNSNENYKQEITVIYKNIVDELLKFQFIGGKDLDYSLCYPRDRFDRQSMHWDLTYFKYYFLKLAKIPFDEQKLENDYAELIDFLQKAESDYFLYRDFQSRNIMLTDGKLYFIDYQGGRKGALQYDLASLLYDAKADLTEEFRAEILQYYILQLKNYKVFDEKEFVNTFYGFVLIRILQAFGTYGYRGFFERKEHFLLSIPYAIENIRWWLENIHIPLKIPELRRILKQITNSNYLKELGEPSKKLTVRVMSFSYKHGIPNDDKGNGGGFVFDCRGLPNPGRFDKYKSLTGNDKEVIEFLEKEISVKEFLNHAFAMVEISLKTYIERGFTDLLVTFGCTGGQHRSVYCASKLAQHIIQKYDVHINLHHREQ